MEEEAAIQTLKKAMRKEAVQPRFSLVMYQRKVVIMDEVVMTVDRIIGFCLRRLPKSVGAVRTVRRTSLSMEKYIEKSEAETSKRVEDNNTCLSEIGVLLLASNSNKPKTKRNIFREAHFAIFKRLFSDYIAHILLGHAFSGSLSQSFVVHLLKS